VFGECAHGCVNLCAWNGQCPPRAKHKMLALSPARLPRLVRPAEWIRLWKVRTGDMVQVVHGKYKKAIGRVMSTDYLRNQVKVAGVHLRKEKDLEGRWRTVERKIHYSRVNLVDPVLQRATRIKIQVGVMQRIVC